MNGEKKLNQKLFLKNFISNTDDVNGKTIIETINIDVNNIIILYDQPQCTYSSRLLNPKKNYPIITKIKLTFLF